MRVLGLFVGVDVQTDNEIRTLPYAGRDAEELHAIFADLNAAHGVSADHTVCLLGKAATKEGIVTALRGLAEKSSEERPELAIVHFSCHGTPDGSILPSDTEDGKESETGISYDELSELIGQIEADSVVVLFDACYSGLAAGKRRIAAGDEEIARQLLESRLAGMSNESTAVVMAAQADQRAWESPRVKHGLLSHGLVASLSGTAIRRPDNTIGLARWVDRAIEIVDEQAKIEGVLQTPKRFIEWTGDPTFPAPTTGQYTARIRERDAVHQVTNAPESISVYGIAPAVTTAIRDLMRGGTFNSLQLRAINEAGVLAGRSVLVSAPTSSGKTLIGYLAALAAAAKRGRAVVLVPSRALASEKYREFANVFGPLGIRAVRSFGGVDDHDPAIRTNQYAIAFLTYEKFLMLALTRHDLLDAVSTIVLDEAQLIADRQRGKNVELLLSLLRRRVKNGSQLQIVALSAAIGELNGFDKWLEVALVQEKDHQRPVPLREGVISPSGMYRWRDVTTGEEGTTQLFDPIASIEPGERRDEVAGRVALALTTALFAIDATEQLLVFRYSRPSVRATAKAIAGRLDLSSCASPLARLAGEGSGRDDSLATEELMLRLQQGVGFHLRDLQQEEREAIEDAFRKGDLRAMVATSGLAMGINTPATSVILVDHEKITATIEQYSVGEYKNMAGRAGRMLTVVRPGTSYLCAVDETDADDLFDRYVRGSVEPLVSQLSAVGADDLVLALLALTGPIPPDQLFDMAMNTFDGFQNGHDAQWRNEKRATIREAVKRMGSEGLVEFVKGTATLSPSGRVLARSTLSAASARAVLAAAKEIEKSGERIDELTLVALAQLTDELKAEYTPAKEWEKWPSVVHEKFLAKRPNTFEVLLNDDATVSSQRFMRLYAVCRWLSCAKTSDIEKELARFHTIRGPVPIASFIRGVAGRTGTVTMPLAKFLALALPNRAENIRNAALALQVRLDVGVEHAATSLTSYRLGLGRGEICELKAIGITEFAVLRDSLIRGDANVVKIFGHSRAGEILSKMNKAAPRAERVRTADDTERRRLFDDIAAVDAI